MNNKMIILFQSEYDQLAKNLSSYVCKLLNNVRGRDELEIVLNKTNKEHEEHFKRLARIDLALKYQEIEVSVYLNLLG